MKKHLIDCTCAKCKVNKATDAAADPGDRDNSPMDCWVSVAQIAALEKRAKEERAAT